VDPIIRARSGRIIKSLGDGILAEFASVAEAVQVKTICYKTVPTMQWLKPSDALVVKMLESWNRKRYGAHQEIAVTYGGVLRLSKDAKPEAIDVEATEVFEDTEPHAQEKRGGHLALAAPAKSAAEFDQRAVAGEFDQAPVTFINAEGERTDLCADLEQKQADL
jgi:class 3 adenylate cyclase